MSLAGTVNWGLMKKNDHSLNELLQVFGQDKRFKRGLTQKKIESIWGEVMGQWIANETESIKFEGSVVVLRIHAPSLRQELHYSKDQIRDRLNEALGEEMILSVIVR